MVSGTVRRSGAARGCGCEGLSWAAAARASSSVLRYWRRARWRARSTRCAWTTRPSPERWKRTSEFEASPRSRRRADPKSVSRGRVLGSERHRQHEGGGDMLLFPWRVLVEPRVKTLTQTIPLSSRGFNFNFNFNVERTTNMHACPTSLRSSHELEIRYARTYAEGLEPTGEPHFAVGVRC